MVMKKYIEFHAGIEYKNKLYLSAVYMNGLFEYDLNTEKVRYIKHFDNENKCRGLHRYAFLYKNEAWFVPEHADNIAVLNLDTLTLTYIKLPVENYDDSITCAKYFKGGNINDNQYFLIPAAMENILIIDLKNKNIETYSINKKKGECYSEGYFYNGTIFMYAMNGKYYLKYNLLSKTYEKVEVEYEKYTYTGMYVDNLSNILWYAPGTGDNILIRNIANNGQKQLHIEIDTNGENGLLKFNWIIPYKQFLFMCGCEIDKILRIDRMTYNLQIIDMNKTRKNDNYYIKMDSNEKLVITCDDGSIYIYNDETNEFDKFNICIEKSELCRMIDSLDLDWEKVFDCLTNDISYENWISFDYMLHTKIKKEAIPCKNGNVGRLIYKSLI
jgi:hypothetical protein